ncbi:hypothetical protein [Pseudomonas tolaasii]|uniref:hypothetical protein n=1 Tax=Pseudomonas tolaasii TaxID=29442 RepID=UPI00037124D4|nr:hypothetical protein [Pseudomonas tolaasii]QXQ16624.1 hypothetical protein I7845_17110 [Pseudomonas tolaasii]
MKPEEIAAWDQYFAAAVIALSTPPDKKTGSPMDELNYLPGSIAHRAAGMADQMLKQRQQRYK